MSDTKSYREVKMGSERSFGVVFAVVFTLVGIWPWLFGRDLRLWALALAAGFLAAAYLFPAVLRPLNILWFKLGLALNSVISPVVMGLMYYVVFVPFGLALRASGKDLLRLRRDPGLATYWISRDGPAPKAGSMKKQF